MQDRETGSNYVWGSGRIPIPGRNSVPFVFAGIATEIRRLAGTACPGARCYFTFFSYPSNVLNMMKGTVLVIRGEIPSI